MQLELPEVEEVIRVVWSRDRCPKPKQSDRLATAYEIAVSLDGKAWTTVAAQAERQSREIAAGLPELGLTGLISGVRLGSLPPGSRLLEIGAGHPYVASLLTRLGYDVTIVDPYDGSGNGPQEYEYFSSSCPAIRFVREVFHAETRGLEANGYDAIYSISVLEHVPIDALPGLCSGIKRFRAPTGRTIHAIDHVLEGMNDGYHTEHLGVLFEHFSPREA